MAIDTTPSQVATSALQAIPFGSMIGGPLKACIEAQAMAAQTSWQFIQEVGLNTDPNTGKKEAVNISFLFMQNGRKCSAIDDCTYSVYRHPRCGHQFQGEYFRILFKC